MLQRMLYSTKNDPKFNSVPCFEDYSTAHKAINDLMSAVVLPCFH